MKIREFLLQGLMPAWLLLSSADAFAVTFHEISFSGVIRDGAQVTSGGHVEQYLFGLRNSANGINAIAQSIPDTLGGGTGTSRFNATFRYEESTDGSLSLDGIDVDLTSTAYVFDLSTGPQGQLVTGQARDIWRVNMDHQGQALFRSSDTGQYIVSIATGVGEAVGCVLQI